MSGECADPKACCVYVVGSPGSPLVKIGRSINVPQRLAAIQSMSPLPLFVLHTHPGGAELETALHRRFKECRTHGEWFAIEGDPVEAVRVAIEQIEPGLVCTRSTSASEENTANFLVAREAPNFEENSVFQPDPKGRRVEAWPQHGLIARPYRVPPGTPVCRCGHAIGTHSNTRPHRCAVDDGWEAEWCSCFGYEGPLPAELSGYDLPGHNWRYWRNEGAT